MRINAAPKPSILNLLTTLGITIAIMRLYAKKYVSRSNSQEKIAMIFGDYVARI